MKLQTTAIALLTVVALSQSAAALNEPDNDAWAAECLAAAQLTKSEFSTYSEGVPASVAQVGVQRINLACFRDIEIPDDYQPVVDSELLRSEVVQTGLSILDDTTICSGGGSTIMGWEDSVIVLDEPFHIQNTPASSYLTYTETKIGDNEFTQLSGHARSTLDNLEFTPMEDGRTSYYWDFAAVPMAGQVSVGSRCAGPLVTSSDVSATGMPLGFDLLPDDVKRLIDADVIIAVQAGGTTCLVPC